MSRNGNRRMAGLAHSEIRAMTAACARVKGINMAQGVCDTPAPDNVIQAAQYAMEHGLNTYTRFDGLAELRQALSIKLAAYNHIIADPDTEITVSAGATGSFHCACLALLNPGDEVILFEPAYAYHINAILAVEAVPRIVAMHPPEWAFSLTDLERTVTSRTKAIVVNTPGNPSGKIFTRMELENIAELADRHDLFVLTDEIYEYFLFDGREHVSVASLSGMADDYDRRILQDIQHHGMANRIQRRACEVGPVDRCDERPALCLRAGSVTIWRGYRHSGIGSVVLHRARP
jgi:aminotransferase